MPINEISTTIGAVQDLGQGKFKIQIVVVCKDDGNEVINTSFYPEYLDKSGKTPTATLNKIRLKINAMVTKYNNAQTFRQKEALTNAVDALQTQVRTDNQIVQE